LSYGLALAAHTYGFLAVFAAGLALRRIERRATGANPPPHELAPTGPTEEIETDDEKAPAYMAHAVLGFNEQLERICEVAVVILIGTMLLPSSIPWSVVWFIPLLLMVIRPMAALPSLWESNTTRLQRIMICWFGIRGVGSMYYLMYGITMGVEPSTARLLYWRHPGNRCDVDHRSRAFGDTHDETLSGQDQYKDNESTAPVISLTTAQLFCYRSRIELKEKSVQS
jgi:sodium/hydrogen antiporter